MLFKEQIYKEIAFTPEFQRLKDVAFLGIFSYSLPQISSISSRYDHSLAVGELCLRYCYKKNFPLEKELHIVLSGLLHDIGHGCFSHSLEPIFNNKFSINHHKITKKIILSSENFCRIWKHYGVNPNKIVDIIDGKTEYNEQIVTKLPVNFDTLDGMFRTEMHFNNNLHFRKLLNNVFRILLNENLNNQKSWDLLDLFWENKERVYSSYIYDEYPKTLESFIEVLFATENSLKKKHFFYSDKEFFAEFPWFKLMLDDIKTGKGNITHMVEKTLPTLVAYRNVRRFKIDSNNKCHANDSDRYSYSKEIRKYKINKLINELEHATS